MLQAAHTPKAAQPAPDPTPRRAVWLLAGMFFVATAVRFALTNFFHKPVTINPDEWRYLEFGRSLAEGTGVRWGGNTGYYPCWLYPLAIAPWLKFLSAKSAFRAIMLTNCLLSAATVFPVYGLAREAGGTRRSALLAGGLAVLMPGLSYTATVMTENLFLPVAALAFWLMFRAIERPTAAHRIWAGLACALTVHIKPHGLLMPPILALTVIVFAAGRLLSRPGAVGGALARLGDYLRAVVCHWLTALAFFAGLVPRVIEAVGFEGARDFAHPFSMVGSYISDAAGLQPLRAFPYVLSIAAYTLGWVFLIGIFPALAGLGEIDGMLRGRFTAKRRLLLILSAAGAVAIILLIARHTLMNDGNWRFHERYLYLFMTPMLALFCVAAPTGRGGWGPGLVRAGFVFLFVAGWWVAAFKFRWNIASDTPSLGGPLLLFFQASVPAKWLIAEAIAGVAALVMVFRGGGGFVRRWAAVAGLFLWANLGIYGAEDTVVKTWNRDAQRLALEIGRKLKQSDRLMVLGEGMRKSFVMQILAWNWGREVHLDPNERPWYAHSLPLGAEGQVSSLFPDRRTFLLASEDWVFNRPPSHYIHGYRLYKVGDSDPPLCFDLAQVTQNLGPESPLKTGDGSKFLEGLKLTFLGKTIPAWQAGKVATVKLLARNDSPFILPRGTISAVVGYYWTDPERTGEWKPEIWNESQRTRVPRGVAPGGQFWIDLNIKAPSRPDRGWILVINSAIIDQKGFHWNPKPDSFIIERVDVDPAGETP